MPIGKNSIKRVQNGGYSKVKTTAPDMENSTILANPSPEVIKVFVSDKKGEKATESKQKITNKSKSAKKTAVASSASASKATKKSAETKAEKSTKKSAKSIPTDKKAVPKTTTADNNLHTVNSYVNFGQPLPVHLL